VLALIILPPVLYVASVEPVARVVQETGGNIEPVAVAYAPLVWGARKSWPIHTALRWYLHQWGYDLPPTYGPGPMPILFRHW
jgi:hypothetical protein